MKINKGLFISSIIATLILVWSAWSVYGKNNDTTGVIQTKTSSATEDDSDNDGLPNWQENIIGTDPYSADTDKDGTPDGVEVRSNRNPLVKGPNDTLRTNSTATEDTTKSILGAYIGPDGTIKSGVNAQELAKTIITNGLDIPYKVYTEKDILIETSVTAKKYGNEAAKILADNAFETDVYAVFSTAVTTQDPAVLTALNEPITYSGFIRDALLLLPTPKSMSSEHIGLINAFERFITNVQLMQDIFGDPIGGTAGMKNFSEDYLIIDTALRNIGKRLVSLGVVYVDEDYGSAFTDDI